MRSSLLTVIAASAGLALSAGAANATIVTGTYSVTGSNFSSVAASPFASITESFTISFDNSVAVSQQTAGITLNASTITPASALAYTYLPGADLLTVGGVAATVATSDTATTDFALTINNASSTSNFGIVNLTYSVGTGAVFTALTTAHAAATATPEPASIGLLGFAIAAFGAMRRRRRS